jgi:hypothetical protein
VSDPKPESATPPPMAEVTTLPDFFERHRGLATTVSVFTTLVTFSGNLTWALEFRALLSGVFLGLTLLLWVEFWRCLVRELREPGLQNGYRFAALLAIALALLATAWIVEFRFIWIEGLPLLVALLVVWGLRGPVRRGLAHLLPSKGVVEEHNGRPARVAESACLLAVGVIVLVVASYFGGPVKASLYAATGRLDAVLPLIIPQAPDEGPRPTPAVPSPTPPPGTAPPSF